MNNAGGVLLLQIRQVSFRKLGFFARWIGTNQFFVDFLGMSDVTLVLFERGGFKQLLGFVGAAQQEEHAESAEYGAGKSHNHFRDRILLNWYASVQMAGSFCGRFDAVSGGCNPFASARGTSAGPGQFCAIAKHEPAVGTGGRFKHESLCAISRQRFHHMRQMVFDLSFRNAQGLRQLIGREPRAAQ